jgi:catechol 2,3-dioxygenase-like lactoylglutathione lyase family enzyme
VRIERLDHLVLTVADIEVTLTFYSQVLGMRIMTFDDDRKALAFGTSKINLHLSGQELAPMAERPTPGSADLCFVVADPLEEVMRALAAAGVAIEEGPVEQTGAAGVMLSCYFRDPDHNLIELSNYVT